MQKLKSNAFTIMQMIMSHIQPLAFSLIFLFQVCYFMVLQGVERQWLPRQLQKLQVKLKDWKVFI